MRLCCPVTSVASGAPPLTDGLGPPAAAAGPEPAVLCPQLAPEVSLVSVMCAAPKLRRWPAACTNLTNKGAQLNRRHMKNTEIKQDHAKLPVESLVSHYVMSSARCRSSCIVPLN